MQKLGSVVSAGKCCARYGESMSLLGRKPILLPDGVSLAVERESVHVRGPAGELTVRRHPGIAVEVVEAAVHVKPAEGAEGLRDSSAQWGTQWALIRNAVLGVTKQFEKQLEIQGVGYRAESSEGTLRLKVGFTHPVELQAPTGVSVRVEKNVVTIQGADKQRVGAFAAEIRGIQPPEPYKGKGIRYVGEVVRRKKGKDSSATTARA